MAQESVTRDDARKSRASELPSIIARGLRIVGNVASDGVVHIEGEVDGDIDCAELTIGPAGRVDGHVSATSVHVCGTMNGTIHARFVTIVAGARVTGEVIHETLTVAPGAHLDGYYRPVPALEKSAAVDLRRQIGRASARESALPLRPLPPRRKGAHRTLPSDAPGETTKPLH
jgi:cytoskeletal protein CcmA (bactofilin family)